MFLGLSSGLSRLRPPSLPVRVVHPHALTPEVIPQVADKDTPRPESPLTVEAIPLLPLFIHVPAQLPNERGMRVAHRLALPSRITTGALPTPLRGVHLLLGARPDAEFPSAAASAWLERHTINQVSLHRARSAPDRPRSVTRLRREAVSWRKGLEVATAARTLPARWRPSHVLVEMATHADARSACGGGVNLPLALTECGSAPACALHGSHSRSMRATSAGCHPSGFTTFPSGRRVTTPPGALRRFAS